MRNKVKMLRARFPNKQPKKKAEKKIENENANKQVFKKKSFQSKSLKLNAL